MFTKKEGVKMRKLSYVALVFVFVFTLPFNSLLAAENQKPPVLKFYTGFHDVGTFYYGLAPVKDANEKLGYIDLQGNVVIDFQYDTDMNYSDMDRSDYIPEPYAPYNHQYKPSETFNFERGYAGVYLNNELIYIDINGNKIDNTFSGKYYFAGPFVNGRAVAQKVKGGLFGYIDEKGDAVTEFKYLSASHFRNGAASVQMVVPFKNGKTKFMPSNNTLTPTEIDELYPVRAYYMPKDKDIIDIYIDIDGSVLAWKFHELNKIDDNFRTGVVYEFNELSEGLILKYDYENDSQNTIRYEYVNGVSAIEFDKELNVSSARPFTKEKIAKVYYQKDGEYFTGYCNNKGELLDDNELMKKYPNLYRNIEFTFLNKNGIGPQHSVVTKDNKKYLVRNKTIIENNIDPFLLKVYLIDSDGSIIMDCTEEIVDQYAKIYSDYWGGSLESAKETINGPSLFLAMGFGKAIENSNIYYIGICKSIREYENVGFIIVEGWE